VIFNGATVQFYVNGTLVSTATLSASITARTLLDNLRILQPHLSAADVQGDMNTGV
jgi:hypothetical protein